MNARIRDLDQRVTRTRGRPHKLLSVVICVRRQVWTDSEVVVLRIPNSLRTKPSINVTTRFPVRLPSVGLDLTASIVMGTTASKPF
ncbi:hypothetical protein ACFXPZ_14650 [Streptomyces sp. NPDC059101]|uniref:hypothetical protein n=1 Tax=Streptomyces sp. NPDC059101 TaxID=3346728 RepID=UPI00367B1CBC